MKGPSQVQIGDECSCSKGQYRGKTLKVVSLLPDRGAQGFAEVKLALPNGDFKASRNGDLVPLQYLRVKTPRS